MPLKAQQLRQWCQFCVLSVQSQKNKFENHSSCNTLLQCLTYPSMPLSCSGSLSGHCCSTPSSPTSSHVNLCFLVVLRKERLSSSMQKT